MDGVLTTDRTASMPKLAGDFYGEVDNVTRGVTLPCGFGLGFDQPCDVHWLSKLDGLGSFQPVGQAFMSTDVPPSLEQETQTYLGVTTIECSYSPITAGNKLVMFLESMVDADTRHLKVSRKKFTIRAEVVEDGFVCGIKIRIYQQECASIVEFQRRSGDIVAFNKLFRKASGYLGKHSCDPIGQDIWISRDIPCVASLPPKEAIAPLLDLVSSCRHTQMLAEVASSLSVIAMDPMVAAQLRMHCAFSVLQELREVSDFSVSFPTSKLLSCL
jgi:hypothetical protein